MTVWVDDTSQGTLPDNEGAGNQSPQVPLKAGGRGACTFLPCKLAEGPEARCQRADLRRSFCSVVLVSHAAVLSAAVSFLARARLFPSADEARRSQFGCSILNLNPKPGILI